jgi:hypothetical protein
MRACATAPRNLMRSCATAQLTGDRSTSAISPRRSLIAAPGRTCCSTGSAAAARCATGPGPPPAASSAPPPRRARSGACARCTPRSRPPPGHPGLHVPPRALTAHRPPDAPSVPAPGRPSVHPWVAGAPAHHLGRRPLTTRPVGSAAAVLLVRPPRPPSSPRRPGPLPGLSSRIARPPARPHKAEVRNSAGNGPPSGEGIRVQANSRDAPPGLHPSGEEPLCTQFRTSPRSTAPDPR